MQEEKAIIYNQSSAYVSARPFSEICFGALWRHVWLVFCAWTPKPLNIWRLFWLRLFGAKLHGKPFVHPLARIHAPWRLTMQDRSAIGENATVYNLGEIELGARCTVAQEVYLCAATHDFENLNLPLVTSKITIGEDAFLGARAFVLPGITIGNGAVIGACSVVTKNVADWTVAAGNPCKSVKPRVIDKSKS